MNLTLNDRQIIHTSRMGQLISFCGAKGLAVKVVEWNRLLKTQEEYVANGVSKTLVSKHIDNCATDLYMMVNQVPTPDPEMYRQLGEFWEKLGGRWGGRFINLIEFKAMHGRDFDPAKDIGWDPVHFETV